MQRRCLNTTEPDVVGTPNTTELLPAAEAAAVGVRVLPKRTTSVQKHGQTALEQLGCLHTHRTPLTAAA